jgi:hypothetical protein
MPITTIVPHKGGGAWGWDDEANSWVPVDTDALNGSFAGNVGRSAGRAFQELEAGVQSIGGQNQQASQTADILRLQGESQAAAAPWATAIGTGVPDMAAGVAAGAMTGGMGLPAMLAGQAAAGAFTGGLRPGSVEERIGNAAMGAGFGVVGGVLGEAATKGIAAALEIGRGITVKNGATMARAIEVGGQRVANAQTRADMEAAAAASAGGGAEGGTALAAGQDVRGQAPVGSSVGAAQNADLPEDTRMWNSALNEDDAHAAGTKQNPRVGQIMEDARSLGYEPSLWAEAGKGSRSRLMGAMEEFSPAKDANEAARVTANSELLNRAAAKSLGLALTLDPEENLFTRITSGDLAKVEDYLDQGYRSVAKELPGIEPKRILNAISDVEEGYRHLAGTDIGMETISQLRQSLAKSDAPIDGKTFMNTIQALTSISADAYSKPGGSQSGQLLYDAVNQLYNLGEKATKDAPAGFGRGSRDNTITGKGWTELRREANMFMILRRPGAIDPAGNVNPRTVYNAMAKQKTGGGFGRGGPPKGNSNYELFKLAEAHGYDQTGVPPTGVRLAGYLAKPALRNAGAAAGAAAGVTGLSALGGSIWGK